MAELRVEIVKIKEINVHPNADRLELATIKGWPIVVQKGMYNSGDEVIFIPIDSILPSELEEKIFPPGSKIKLTKHRVRSIKIRKALSQGMIIPLWYISDNVISYKVGDDVKDILGITKYEPPVRAQAILTGNARSKKRNNPHFNKYSDLQHYKNYPELFKECDQIAITEKCHGTSFRAGYAPFDANRWWKKFLQFIKLAPKYEWVYGSRNVQFQNKIRKKIFYSTNVYAECVETYGLKDKLKPNEIIYGEIYGHGIQKNYTYGCKNNEHKFIAYDVKIDGQWLDYNAFLSFCHQRRIPYAPHLYSGCYNKDELSQYMAGPSELSKDQKVKEGIVIRSTKEQQTYAGRAVLKYINDEYLLMKGQSDLH